MYTKGVVFESDEGNGHEIEILDPDGDVIDTLWTPHQEYETAKEWLETRADNLLSHLNR